MTKEVNSDGGDPRKALRMHLARCGVCLTTDPAAMCEVGDVLLEAAAAEMLGGRHATAKEDQPMSGNERMPRESLLDHAVVCSHGCAIEGSKVVKVCPTGQEVQDKINSLPQDNVAREEGDDEIPF